MQQYLDYLLNDSNEFFSVEQKGYFMHSVIISKDDTS
jgi:hypothetical protein